MKDKIKEFYDSNLKRKVVPKERALGSKWFSDFWNQFNSDEEITQRFYDTRKIDNIDFDDFIARDIIGDFGKEFKWFKNNELIHELKVQFTKYPVCPACLFWRGEAIEMSLKKTIFRGSESYTYRQCPYCRGVDNFTQCTCSEAPHRIDCPMGFNLYFEGK